MIIAKSINPHKFHVNMANEVWKDLIGYEGQYQVSNLGKVRTLDYKKTGTIRLMKLEKRKHGLYVMTKDFVRHEVHVLVARAFIYEYEDGMEIKHKDGNILNNNSENLECYTPQQFVSLEGEEWRNVVGFEGRYEVSNLGRVRSLVKYSRWQKVPRLLTTRINCNGYLMIMLKAEDGSFKTDVVHRLVARAFVDGYQKGLVVNHRDENKLNNHADNLEWITSRENTLYGSAIKKMEAKVLADMAQEVERFAPNGNVIAIYKSLSAASRSTGLSIAAIKARCRRHAEGWRMKGDGFIPKQDKEEVRNPEEWRDVVGYEGRYQVSSWGRVKAMARHICSGFIMNGIVPEKMLKLRSNKNGRLTVSLTLNGMQKNKQVHRLVAMAFLTRPSEEYDQVNHKDENPQNNYVGNLEWCTSKYNANYGIHHLNNQEMHHIVEQRNRLSLYGAEKPVLCIDEDGCVIRRYKSLSAAARLLKLSSSHISACCKGKRLTVGGYRWAYDNEQ